MTNDYKFKVGDLIQLTAYDLTLAKGAVYGFRGDRAKEFAANPNNQKNNKCYDGKYIILKIDADSFTAKKQMGGIETHPTNMLTDKNLLVAQE